MNWRKKISLLFLPLIALGVFWSLNSPEVPQAAKTTREVASIPFKKEKNPSPAVKKNLSSRPGVIKGLHKKVINFKNRIPQSLAETFQKDKSISLTRGFIFIKNIAAISKDKFHPSMGKVVQRSEQFVFFRSETNHRYIPVAISRTTNVLYPISSILHIKGATPGIRRTLLSAGLKQYYYHEPLKLLSLQSSSTGVVSLYSELRQKGYQVELEVLKPPHRRI